MKSVQKTDPRSKPARRIARHVLIGEVHRAMLEAAARGDAVVMAMCSLVMVSGKRPLRVVRALEETYEETKKVISAVAAEQVSQ
jgi:hypothetical protein